LVDGLKVGSIISGIRERYVPLFETSDRVYAASLHFGKGLDAVAEVTAVNRFSNFYVTNVTVHALMVYSAFDAGAEVERSTLLQNISRGGLSNARQLKA
jgi:hypothetical protein